MKYELRNKKGKKQADWNPQTFELTIREKGIDTVYKLSKEQAVCIREEIIKK